MTPARDMNKAALRGEPSYVWRAGQDRRLKMTLEAFEDRARGQVLENGCGIGMYVERLLPFGEKVMGLEFDFERAREASDRLQQQIGLDQAIIVNAAGEELPFPNKSFDAILSHEVLEHVRDDKQAFGEMVRVLKTGGRIVLFVPNRGYPFETHGIYWRGRYRFGNIPLVNWLPRTWRDRLAPHVRVYSSRELMTLIHGFPVLIRQRMIIFGAYDNIIYRWPIPGRILRWLLQGLEKTPLRILGLSHFWVIEKTAD